MAAALILPGVGWVVRKSLVQLPCLVIYYWRTEHVPYHMDGYYWVVAAEAAMTFGTKVEGSVVFEVAHPWVLLDKQNSVKEALTTSVFCFLARCQHNIWAC